jgi:chromosome segregation ATPase
LTQNSERPLFPDSYRRSPKGKGRSRDAADSGQEHKPGSIVRVKLTDFVTYTNAEFHPGPNLNMVIGPNGTGKSTLVCAICLGLGWPPVHLGRAKNISEFIKHGAKKAKVEIELKGDPDRHAQNPVITTIINKDGGKSAESKTQFLIDRKRSTKKAVQDLARSFSIQVDNLCQFLPQDRVVEFAALSPIDLLVETQRAAAPEEMSKWHEELKVMRKEEKIKQNEQQIGIEQLKSMEDRQKSQEVEVGRMRERTTLQERITTLNKMKPFAAWAMLKKEYLVVNQRRKEARREVRDLEAQTEPRRLEVAAKHEYHAQLKHVSVARNRLLERTEADVETKRLKIAKTQKSLEDCEKEIKAEKDNGQKARQDINKYQVEIRKLERLLASPPAEFDPAAMNEDLRKLRQQKRELDEQLNGIGGQVDTLSAQHRQRQEVLKQKNTEAQSLQSQAGRQANKLLQISRDAAKAWTWIQGNLTRFAGQVYGPPMITCTVTDPRYTDAVEQVVGKSELQAFTVTDQADFKMLLNQLQNVMGLSDVNVRASLANLADFRPPHSDAELHALGFQCWIRDVIEGPEAVIAMLCDNRNIHQTALGDQPVPENMERELERSSISAYATSTKFYSIARRREYGEGAVVTRVQAIRKADHLTDAPVDTQAAGQIRRDINETEDDIRMIEEEIQGLRAKNAQLQKELSDLNKEVTKVTQDKAAKQAQDTYFKSLPTRLEGFENKLESAQTSVTEQSGRILEITEKADKLCQDKGQQCLDYANAVVVLRDLHVKFLEAEIMRIEAKSDLEQLEAQQTSEERLLVERTEERDQLIRNAADLLQRIRRDADECERLGQQFTPEETAVQEEVADKDPAELELEIQAAEASLEALHGGNENVIREYEQRAKKIEEKRARLDSVETSLNELTAKITEIRDLWEPRLDHLISQISDAFAENFAGIQCAGEVGVFKDDDFENWAIQIKVKFRYADTIEDWLIRHTDKNLTGRMSSSASWTPTVSQAASAPCPPYSTSWHCRAWPEHRSALSTKLTRAWTRATRGL